MDSSAPATIDIDQHPGHMIRRLHQISVGIFLQETSELAVTPVQYAALQVVHNQPGIDRLEARGWLERRMSPDDRRARQLFLTPAGGQGLADTLPALLRAQEQILAPLTPRQRTEFMRLLQVLVTQNNDLSRAPSEAAR
jgi:MarR family transcriptional regulator, lower aerobic nicotinate degradation pathway regulator